MAGKVVKTPGITGSEELINCTPCSEAERTTVALKYCVDCTTYVCQDCLNDHNKFAALRKHQIVEITEANELLGAEQIQGKRSVECGSHYGQFIDRYCRSHDEVCCRICVTIKHRLCKEITGIETVAGGIKESQEFCALKSSLQKLRKSAIQEKFYRNQNLKEMMEEKKKILADIDEQEERLIQKIRVLANTSRENIQEAHAKHQNAVKADIKELDSVISGLKKSLHNINRHDMNEVETFISKKNYQTTLEEVQRVVTDLSNHWLQTSLLYKFNDKVIPQETTALGEVVEETKESPVFHLQLKQSVDITCQTDSNICSINGICQLPDKTVVITDAKNAKLKRLGDNLEVKDYIDLNDTPECMCVTTPQEVAIVLRERNVVQFVTIDENITLESSFPVIGTCILIDFDPRENTLYVCCRCAMPYDFNYAWESKHPVIFVYNIAGTCLSIYNSDKDAHKYFDKPLKMLVGGNALSVIDANAEIHVYTLSKTDMKQVQETNRCKEFPHHNLRNWDRYPRACKMAAEKILLWGWIGDMSLRSLDGKNIKTIKIEDLSPVTGDPVLSICFNEKKSTLIVAGESCKIKEYKMGSKILNLLKE